MDWSRVDYLSIIVMLLSAGEHLFLWHPFTVMVNLSKYFQKKKKTHLDGFSVSKFSTKSHFRVNYFFKNIIWQIIIIIYLFFYFTHVLIQNRLVLCHWFHHGQCMKMCKTESVESCWHQCPVISHKKPFASLPTQLHTSASHQLLFTVLLWYHHVANMILKTSHVTLHKCRCVYYNICVPLVIQMHIKYNLVIPCMLYVCILTDPILTTEIAPSFVPLTRVSHRNLRSTIYRYITPLTHADTRDLFSVYTRQHFINTKLPIFLFSSTSSSLQPTQNRWILGRLWIMGLVLSCYTGPVM